ncbi:MAG: hypothetical protein JNM36_04940 [Chitinophagales bacterium]|nr:hypothetical protein [Chitinophagales bacterium]
MPKNDFFFRKAVLLLLLSFLLLYTYEHVSGTVFPYYGIKYTKTTNTPVVVTYHSDRGQNDQTQNMGFKPAPPPCTISGCEVYADTVRINVGGSAITTNDSEGRTFEASSSYRLYGTTTTTASAITNVNTGAPNGTSGQSLYQTQLGAPSLDWHFAIPNGTYTVLLHLAEISSSATASSRIFDVYAEDVKVEDNLNLYVAAGNTINRAFVRTYTTTVSDGDLLLHFEREVGNVSIAGIEIIPNYCKVTQSVTINNVSVSGCYLNSSNQSKSTISVEVGWQNVLSLDTIRVVLGSQIRLILPGQYNTTDSKGTILSPQVVAFEIDADASSGNISTYISGNTSCAAVTASYTAPAACPAPVCSSGNLGGQVFNDYNANGTQEAGETFGISGITVEVTDNNNNVVTTTTSMNGLWSITSALVYPVRVEFINLPAYVGDYGTPNGTTGRTTTQFISAPDCDVDLGVLNSSDLGCTEWNKKFPRLSIKKSSDFFAFFG